MRAATISLILLGIFCFTGCGKQSPDDASDDDIYRAYARANGESEEAALNRAHRVKDDNAAEYAAEVQRLRHLIKYYGSDDGSTTLEQYVQMSQEKAKKDKVTHGASVRETTEKDALAAKEADARQTLLNQRHQQIRDIETKYNALEKQLDGEYKPKIAAIQSDRTNPNRLDDADSMTHELANKREELFKQRQAEEKKVTDAMN